MYNFEKKLNNYLLTEAYKMNDTKDVWEALKTKKVGVKVDPSFNDITGEKLEVFNIRFNRFFDKCRELNIPDTTYGVQLILSKSNLNTYGVMIDNDAIYEFLKSYKKPWVKELESYNKVMSEKYDSKLWHELEKDIQNNQSNHGKASKGSGDMNGVKVLYPKDENGWQLLMPLNFEGEKAAAFYGKEGGPQKPTSWCTRCDKGYYDRYTNRNEHPLYIIRNWKTGKSYQLGFTLDWDADDEEELEVHFLDQDDVKGDDIALGDLTQVPDNLLKFMKVPFGKAKGKTLYDYKKAKPVDPNEGKPGYTDRRKQTFKDGRIVNERYFRKACDLEHVSYGEVVKETGRMMCSVSKGGAYPQSSSRGDKLSSYFDSGVKEVNNYGQKAGIRRYYFEKMPNTFVEIIANKSHKPSLNNRGGESGLLTSILQYAGFLDMGVDVISHMGDIRDKNDYKNTQKKIDYHKKMDQVRELTERQLSDLLMGMKVKKFDDSTESFRQKLPKNAEFKEWGTRVIGKVMPGRRMTVEFQNGLTVQSSVSKGRWSKEAMKVYDAEDMEQVTDPKIIDLCWKLAYTYNKNWRKVFQNEIIGNRMEGNYESNMYEEVNYFGY